MNSLRVWYGLLSHAAGPERRIVLHATTPAVAERMAWAAHRGPKQYWNVVLVEALDYAATTEVLR
jgi:hypothetical protein